jgi:beta-galactosidase
MIYHRFLTSLALTLGVAVNLPAQTSNLQQNLDRPARLSPLPVSASGIKTPKITLDGQWEFEHQGKTDPINVPGEWVMQGFTISQGETAVYHKKLDIPKNWDGQRIKLRFDGVSSHAIVKVNGVKVAEHEGSFVPFEVDITDALKNGGNKLTIEVQANTISDILACTSQYAVHTVGGILRHVTLFAVPVVNLSDLTVITKFDKSYRDATIALKAIVANEGKESASAQLNYTLLNKEGKIVLSGQSENKAITSASVTRLDNSFAIKSPMQWNTEQPYLYTLITTVKVNGKEVEKNQQKIGFRQVEVKGNQVLVNGKAIKLRGVNRHSVHPLSGRSIADNLERQDAKLFKEGNCNYIRTSHYPPSQEFLAAADSLGLFVENESSLCWIQHNASPIWKLWNYKDEEFLPPMVMANLEKMQAAKNNPSVIIWSLGNESRWSPLWQKVLDKVKAFDQTRPTSFHDQCWGGFNNDGSKADIANYHYPGINGPKATDTMKRPTLFGEYAHLSTYNRLALATDPGMRSAYGLPLVKMYDSMYVHKGNLGGAIWSGIDDTFHLPDGNLVGYGSWGPVDGWRREKPEYWGMKKAYAPVVIKNWKNPEIRKGKLILQVENRYDFASLSALKIKCLVDGKPVAVSANIGARQKGNIQIPVGKNSGEVYIAFFDPIGFLANEELISFGKAIKTTSNDNVEVNVEENEMAYLIKQGGINYTISKINGIIVNATRDGKQLLTQGPVFAFVGMNSDDGGKPNVAGETLQNNIHPVKGYPAYTIFANNFKLEKEKNSISLSCDATYTNGKGKMSYQFLKDGTVKVSYEAEVKDDNPYQYGLLFQLPKQFDQLSWKRNGEFSTYPDDHIARVNGTAQLNAANLATTEQWGKQQAKLWKDDANEMGSNDFRSTKTQIVNFELSNKSKDGLTIISNGKQAGRTWLQDEKIQVLVADYSNNGSEPFYGSPFTDGQIKTKGKVLKGSVVFKLR